jgi:RNA polymerase sigma-70 factor (ECF subfamily)
MTKEEERDFRNGLVEMVPVLRAFARSLCGKRDLADDLAQETLAKALQARDKFRPGTNLKAWLFVILRNEFYSNHRRAKTVANYAATEGLHSESMEPEQHASLDLSDLMRAFNQLPFEQKEALILTAGEFSYDEAAAICGCAVGTIKSRVSRARKRLESLVEGKMAYYRAGRNNRVILPMRSSHSAGLSPRRLPGKDRRHAGGAGVC